MVVTHTWKKYNVNVTDNSYIKTDISLYTTFGGSLNSKIITNTWGSVSSKLTYSQSNGIITSMDFPSNLNAKTYTVEEFWKAKETDGIYGSFDLLKFPNPNEWTRYDTPNPNLIYWLRGSSTDDTVLPVSGFKYVPNYSYSRGSYIGDVTAADVNAYPEDGQHSDGYWYVYEGNDAPTELKSSVIIDHISRPLTGESYVNIGGIWKPVVKTFMCIGNIWKSMQSSRVPYGYTELEYIQSSGTQYIDTGFKHNNNTHVVIDFEPYPTVRCPTPFGAANSNMGNALLFCYYIPSFDGVTDSNLYAYHYYETSSRVVVQAPWYRHIIDANKNVVYQDGKTLFNRSTTSFSCSYNLFLFAVNNAGKAEDISEMRLYSCQIYDNGTLVRDFVPCINPSGAVGIWDKVNGVFYGNAGTGSFTAGN